MRTLLDLRFADDFLLFAKTFQETKFLLECVKNEGIDNSVTKSARGASSKWTGNCDVRPWPYS